MRQHDLSRADVARLGRKSRWTIQSYLIGRRSVPMAFLRLLELELTRRGRVA